MKAVVLTGTGGPEVLKLEDVRVPGGGDPGPGEVLVRVRAVGVNPIDYKLRKTGAMGIGAGRILGLDVAGEIEKVGPGAEGGGGRKEGEKVLYVAEFTQSGGAGGPGGYAEYNMARAGNLTRMPGGVSFVQAAAMPLAWSTAWESVMNRGQLRAGETVLIAAANGGVGSVAVQMCKAAGAFVIGTCSERSMEFVKSIPRVGGKGPDRVFDYRKDWPGEMKEMFEKDPAAGGGIDLVFDCAGQDVVLKAAGLLKRGADDVGRIVSIVDPKGEFKELYRTNTALHYVSMIHKRVSLEPLRLMMERGEVVPLIDSVMKLAEVGKAHEALEEGGVKGKIVLEV